MITLEPEDAYRLWASTYGEETAISLLENDLAAELSPSVSGKRLLDAGCGTARRLAGQEPALAIGIDRCCEMLLAGDEQSVAVAVAVADVRALPLPADFFDVVWCRLVLGHIGNPLAAYRELARVCRPGGTLFVSDFHADAAAAGHTRSFRDRSGQVYAVKHHVHDESSHLGAARTAGLRAIEHRDGRIGSRIRHLYVRAGRDADYKRDFGLPVVTAFLFERTADAPPP